MQIRSRDLTAPQSFKISYQAVIKLLFSFQ